MIIFNIDVKSFTWVQLMRIYVFNFKLSDFKLISRVMVVEDI